MPGPANSLNISEPGFQSFDGVSIFKGRTLTPGNGVTITNGDGIAGNPVIGLVGSGVAVEHLTGDTGGQLNPDASNNFNLIGQQAGTIPVMESIGSGSTIKFEDRTWPTKFVVDTSTTVGLRGTYSTMASAIAAASAGDTIILRSSITENFTVDKNLNFVSFGAVLRGTTILNKITGKITVSANNVIVNFNNIEFQTNSDNCFLLSGTSSAITTESCSFRATNSDIISGTGTNSNFYMENCTASFSSTYTLYISTGTIIWINNCNYYDATTPGSSSTTVPAYINSSWINIPLSTTTTGHIQATYTKFGTIFTPYADLTFITTAGTSGAVLNHCEIYSGTQSTISIGSGTTVECYDSIIHSNNVDSITGAGTLKYSGLQFVGSSSLINVTTQIPSVTSNDAVGFTTPGSYPYTTIPQDNVILIDSSTARTIVPLASPTTGQKHILKDNVGSAGANNITVTPSGKNIDGAASFVMSTNYQSITIVYNGTQWNII